MPPISPGERIIFLGGCPRSGLTLLRVILDAHPEISCGPDSGALSLAVAARDFASTLGALHSEHFHLPPERVRANFAAAISAILESRRRRDGKARAAEKSPMNVVLFPVFAELFPEAQFIHVVRDGRDVAASLMSRDWREAQSGRRFDYSADPQAAGRYWSNLVDLGLTAERSIGRARVYRLPYESLAREPEAALRALFAFLGCKWSGDVLGFHERNLDLVGLETESASELRAPIHANSVGRHRALEPDIIDAIVRPARGALKSLGYL